MRRIAFIWFAFFPALVWAQKENNAIIKGNEAYRAKDYVSATESYRKALAISPSSPVASFNLGNTFFRDNNADKAIGQFESITGSEAPVPTRSAAYYNKGVVLTRQKKLQESIEAYKDALRLNPTDSLARQNLQRALNELRRQQQNDQKDQQQKKKPDKLNKQQVQQMLAALQEQEKLLQQKINQSKVPAPGQPDKDW
jgi:tetratricopeptide (TPR) repeat protein